jgi:hypothetical protein
MGEVPVVVEVDAGNAAEAVCRSEAEDLVVLDRAKVDERAALDELAPESWESCSRTTSLIFKSSDMPVDDCVCCE